MRNSKTFNKETNSVVKLFSLSAVILLCSFQVHAQVDTVKICNGENILMNIGSNWSGDIQWEVSTNGFSFTDLFEADDNLHSLIVSDSRYYRARVTTGSCNPTYSEVLYIKRSEQESFEQATTVDFAMNTNSSTDSSNDNISLEVIPVLNVGNGSDGAFNPSGDTTLPGGAYNFTTVNIAAGDTVFVTGSTPLEIYATQNANIDGVIFLDGEDGQDGGNNSPPGAGGAGGGGGGFAGGDGGDGWVTTSASYDGESGFGPGGGEGGLTQTTWYGGGGGSYGTAGTSGVNSTTGIGNPGPVYGTAMLNTLQGGSGGGGGAADDDAAGMGSGDDGGGGGGGGGGAIRINADTITVGGTGVITADGGNGGSCGNGGGGAGGSGGAIFLQAFEMTMAGTLSSQGGVSNATSTTTFGGDGGDGRIRLDYINLNGSGTITPAVGHTGVAGSYSPTGTTESIPISILPADFCGWNILDLDVDTSLAGTSIVVDILDNSGNVLATNVADGTDLSTLSGVTGNPTIKLKATLSTSMPSNTPVLNAWKVSYYEK